MTITTLSLPLGRAIGAYLDDPRLPPCISKKHAEFWKEMRNRCYELVLPALSQGHLRPLPNTQPKELLRLYSQVVELHKKEGQLLGVSVRGTWMRAQVHAANNVFRFFTLCEASHHKNNPYEAAALSARTRRQALSLCRYTAQLMEVTMLDIRATAETFLTRVPSAIAGFHQLRALRFAGHPLPVLPPEIGDLPNLRVLEVSRCRLVAVPDEIENLKKLTSLNLHHNEMTRLSIAVTKIASLTRLNVSFNKLETLPGELHFLPLEHLNIEDNPFDRGLPDVLRSSQKPAIKYAFESLMRQHPAVAPGCCVQ